MSGRGASSRKAAGTDFEFLPVPALTRPVLGVAKELLAMGLRSADVCSLFTHAAAILAHQEDGLSRAELLELVAKLYDEDEVDTDAALTAPGGSA
jgi:hypothetical protein